MARLTEEKQTRIFILLSVVLLFLLINYDPTLAIAYISISFLNLIIYQNYSHFAFTFYKDASILKTVIVGVVAYGAFVAFSTLVGNFFAPNLITSPQSVLQLMSETIPVLQGSLFLTILSLGIIVPIVETDFFFGRLNEFLADHFKINTKFDITNPRLWVLAVIVGAIFAMFHLSAKISNLNIGLAFTFLFGMISCWMVYKYRRTAEAVVFHITANTLYIVIALAPELLRQAGNII